jgi:vitamin B12 transporter
VTEDLELYGRIENLFDTEYQTVAGYRAYGRNAHFGLRAKF